MDNLVVGIRQNEVFGKRIAHRKSNFVMMVMPEEGIHRHILERIVHKAHVPLE